MVDTTAPRIQSGVPGFDQIAGGGFVNGTVNVICGSPGSAKTLFALQFLHRGGWDHGETGLFVTLEESREALRGVLQSFGLDVRQLETMGRVFLVDLAELRRRQKGSSDEASVAGFNALSELIKQMHSTRKIQRLALDSLTAAALYDQDDPAKLRQHMFQFVSDLRNLEGLTSVLLAESVDRLGEEPRHGIEHFMADSHVSLGLELMPGEMRRSLRVNKMRYTKHDSAKHPLLITGSGLEVEPESVVE